MLRPWGPPQNGQRPLFHELTARSQSSAVLLEELGGVTSHDKQHFSVVPPPKGPKFLTAGTGDFLRAQVWRGRGSSGGPPPHAGFVQWRSRTVVLAGLISCSEKS